MKRGDTVVLTDGRRGGIVLIEIFRDGVALWFDAGDYAIWARLEEIDWPATEEELCE